MADAMTPKAQSPTNTEAPEDWTSGMFKKSMASWMQNSDVSKGFQATLAESNKFLTGLHEDLETDSFMRSLGQYSGTTGAAGVEPSTYTAKSGDSISRLMGTSDPLAIGAFMRANGLRTDVIREGKNYIIPNDIRAYGDGTEEAGQWALDKGNARQAQAQAQARWNISQERADLMNAPTPEMLAAKKWLESMPAGGTDWIGKAEGLRDQLRNSWVGEGSYRVLGGLRAAGGILAVDVSAGLDLTGIGAVVGIPLGIWGVSEANAGVRMAWNGSRTPVTSLIEGTFISAGMSPEWASFSNSAMGLGLGMATLRVPAQTWTSQYAAQMELDAARQVSNTGLEFPAGPPTSPASKISVSKLASFTDPVYGEVKPGLYYQAQRFGQSRPGEFFGSIKPLDSLDAEELFNIKAWGNNAEQLGVFEIKPGLTAWQGGVRGGVGDQIFIPKEFHMDFIQQIDQQRLYLRNIQKLMVSP